MEENISVNASEPLLLKKDDLQEKNSFFLNSSMASSFAEAKTMSLSRQLKKNKKNIKCKKENCLHEKIIRSKTEEEILNDSSYTNRDNSEDNKSSSFHFSQQDEIFVYPLRTHPSSFSSNFSMSTSLLNSGRNRSETSLNNYTEKHNYCHGISKSSSSYSSSLLTSSTLYKKVAQRLSFLFFSKNNDHESSSHSSSCCFSSSWRSSDLHSSCLQQLSAIYSDPCIAASSSFLPKPGFLSELSHSSGVDYFDFPESNTTSVASFNSSSVPPISVCVESLNTFKLKRKQEETKSRKTNELGVTDTLDSGIVEEGGGYNNKAAAEEEEEEEYAATSNFSSPTSNSCFSDKSFLLNEKLKNARNVSNKNNISRDRNYNVNNVQGNKIIKKEANVKNSLASAASSYSSRVSSLSTSCINSSESAASFPCSSSVTQINSRFSARLSFPCSSQMASSSCCYSSCFSSSCSLATAAAPLGISSYSKFASSFPLKQQQRHRRFTVFEVRNGKCKRIEMQTLDLLKIVHGYNKNKELEDTAVGALKLRDLRQVVSINGMQRPSIEPRRNCILINMPPIRCIVQHKRVLYIPNVYENLQRYCEVCNDAEDASKLKQLINNNNSNNICCNYSNSNHINSFNNYENMILNYHNRRNVSNEEEQLITNNSCYKYEQNLNDNNAARFNVICNYDDDEACMLRGTGEDLRAGDIFASSGALEKKKGYESKKEMLSFGDFFKEVNSQPAEHIFQHKADFEGCNGYMNIINNSNNVIDIVNKEDVRLINKFKNLSEMRSSSVFEFCVLECILIEICIKLANDLSPIKNAADALLFYINKKPGSTKRLHEVTDLRRRLDNINDQVKGVQTALKEILDTEDDLRRLEISRFWENPSDWEKPPDSVAAEDVEILLECYEQEIECLLKIITRTDDMLDDALQMVELHLASVRNTFLKSELGLDIVSVTIGFVAAIGGIFGMNIKSGFEQNENMFWILTNFLILLCFLTGLFVVFLFKRLKL